MSRSGLDWPALLRRWQRYRHEARVDHYEIGPALVCLLASFWRFKCAVFRGVPRQKLSLENEPFQANPEVEFQARKTKGLPRLKSAPKRQLMKIGHARVSTDEQTTAAQLHALRAEGCSAIYQEQTSGAARRPQLAEALGALTSGAALVVWRFDRSGRSLPDLLQIAERIEAAGAHLVSLTEQIDTSSSAGRMDFRSCPRQR